jgi:hypothetical protein
MSLVKVRALPGTRLQFVAQVEDLPGLLLYIYSGRPEAVLWTKGIRIWADIL